MFTLIFHCKSLVALHSTDTDTHSQLTLTACIVNKVNFYRSSQRRKKGKIFVLISNTYYQYLVCVQIDSYLLCLLCLQGYSFCCDFSNSK